MQTVIEDGNLIIRAETQDEHGLVCNLAAIAAWQALLGTATYAETCAAMTQARESKESYDPETGRNAWTTAYEGLEAALSDTAAQTVDMLSDTGEIQDDPMTAARNKTRAALGLPTITNAADTAIRTAALADDETTPTTGIDTSGIDASTIEKLLSDDSIQTKLEEAEENFYMALMPQNQERK